MIKNSIFFALIALFSLLVKPTNTHAVNYNLTGQWDWIDATQNMAFHGTAQINHEGTTLTFTWTWDSNSPPGSPPLWTGSGSTSDSTLSLDGVFGSSGLTAHWDGTILENGNGLEGTWLQSDGQHGIFIATRIGPAPSPFPDPSPTPEPFLDLPWDYQSKSLSFSEAALAINSYFDHEYPFLSSGLSEPQTFRDSIVGYLGPPRVDRPYSSHDGYDWGKDAEANINELVLAAADGCASYFKDGVTGNAIKIDHGNGYQTRYYHLSDIDLITQSPECVNVIQGQQIGRVGATGNVIPPGDLGAHIHFMVVQDKNNDGNFDDNIPDGVTDPFGWQSTEPDPWTDFNFFYSEENRTGNESFYLWTKAIANLSNQLTSNGGFFELERYKLEFPKDATNQNLTLEMQATPIAKPSNILESIGSTITITAKDALGNIVDTFQNFLTITIQFDGFDLSGYNVDTISIYSSEDGINWVKEETTVNLNEKTASASLNHLSHFALMAERLDTTAPITTAFLSGNQGQPNWFRSDAQVILEAQDNEGGLGVDYTLYKINNEDWQQYSSPLTFTSEGTHTIQFYSVDKDENIEGIKSVIFTLDKTPPEAQIAFDVNNQKIEVIGIDNSGGEVDIDSSSSYKLTDFAGNVLIIETDGKSNRQIEIEKLIYNQTKFELPENSLKIEFKKKKNKIDKFTQTFQLGDLSVKISYDKKKDQSVIEKRQGKKKPTKETKPGIVILNLNTNQGNIEYFY